jgi:hypothetical protein
VSILDSFTSEDLLKSTLVNIDGFLGSPRNLLDCESYLILKDKVEGFSFALIDKKNMKIIKRFGILGKGPNELLGSITLDYNGNNTITVYDDIARKLIYYSIDSILNNSSQNGISNMASLSISTPENTPQYIIKAVPASDSLILTSCAHPKGRYAIIDKNRKFRNICYTDFPNDDEKEHINEGYLIKSHAFQQQLKISPDKSKFISAATSNGFFETFTIDGVSIVRKCKKVFDLPIYKVIQMKGMPNPAAAKSSTSKPGFHGLIATNDFILLSYPSIININNNHDLNKNNYLLKFDWDGKPIIKYKLDRKIGHFTYDEKSGIIYANATDSITFNPIIIAFQIR